MATNGKQIKGFHDTIPKDTVPKDTIPKDTIPKVNIPKGTIPNQTLSRKHKRIQLLLQKLGRFANFELFSTLQTGLAFLN